MIAEKHTIRTAIRRVNLLRTAEERSASSSIICSRILEFAPFVGAHSVLFYYPLPVEVDILPLLTATAYQKQLYLPRMNGERLDIVPYRGNDQLRKGAFGVMEPLGDPLNDLSQIDCTLVPGVAFDLKNNRLGYGKGYYDRLLPLLTRSYTIGVCFHSNLLSSLPIQSTDQPVDYVVTD